MASIRLTQAQRQGLLDQYRRSADPAVGHRAHILLLLADGHPWATIRAVLFCSFGTISRWKARFEAEGVDAVYGRPRGHRRTGIHIWATLVVRWVLTYSPTAFRFARSRWSCEAAAVVLRDDFRVRVGRETVRLWLRDAGLVWRRPRPVIRPKDPDREAKLRALRALLRGLPADETAVFMDEVDVSLNPKVGCQWVRKGEQAAVETPGTNEKRYLAGSIHWRTGRVSLLDAGVTRKLIAAALATVCRPTGSAETPVAPLFRAYTAEAGSIQIGDGLYVRVCAARRPGVGSALDTGWLPLESAENVTGDYTPVVRVTVELGTFAQAVQGRRDDSERT